MRKVFMIICACIILCGCRSYAAAQQVDTAESGDTNSSSEITGSDETAISDVIATPSVTPYIEPSAEPDAGSSYSFPESTTFAGLLVELGVSLDRDISSYEYVCENATVITGELFNTAPFFLEGYLKNLSLRKGDSSEDLGEAVILVFKKGEKAYRVRLSEEKLAVYDKADHMSAPIAVYSLPADSLSLAELRLLLFRQEQTESYLENTYTAIPASSDTLLKTNSLYSIDLDGDGEDDKLYVAYFGRRWNWNWGTAPDIVFDGEYPSGEYIYVNGELKYFRKFAESPESEVFGLTSFGQTGAQYVITYDNGYSNDPSSYFYLLRNGEAVIAGEVPDCLFKREEIETTDGNVIMVYSDFDRDKVFTDSVRFESMFGIIQMWNMKGIYTIDKDGRLILESAVFSAVDDTPFDLLYPVYVYENPDGTGKSTMIEPGKILMDDTDGEKMVHIKTVDGTAAGWINAENPEDNLCEENKGQNLSGYDLFDGYYAAG